MNILFVDNEPMILDSLRRRLRPLRADWSVFMAKSTTEALALLEQQPCEVVVSDIAMPGRSGVELLDEIAQRWPATIRIALTGLTDIASGLRSVRVSHQYLAKPYDIDTLLATIERTQRTRRAIENPELVALIGSLESIPSLPTVYTELMTALKDSEFSMQSIGAIINRDIGMTASLLRLVNSAYFSLPRQINSPVEAAALLGVDILQTLVLGLGIFQQFEQHREDKLSISHLSNHSLYVATLAKQAAKLSGLDRRQADLAYTAGLLHDVGVLVLAANCSERLNQALEMAEAEHIASWQTEQRVFKSSHMEVGAYLLAIWGLPEAVVEAAAFHHTPREAGASTQPSILAMVHIADGVAKQCYGAGFGQEIASLDEAYIETTGLSDVAAQLLHEATGTA